MFNQRSGNRSCVAAAAAAIVAAALMVPTIAPASVALDDLTICRKTLSKQGANYGKKRRQTLLKCVDKLLKCDLQQEVEGVNPSSCLSSALNACTAGLGTGGSIDTAATNFKNKAGTPCLLVSPFSDITKNTAGGLWYSNDTTCASSSDVPTLLNCLIGEINAKVDEMVARTKPRAGILLTNAGFGSSYPNVAPPATVPVLVSATSPGSGTLVNPGTITVPAGETVTFSGDASLSCGGGKNGHLTISAGTGTSCGDISVLQQGTVKEPYGPGDTVTVGPFAFDHIYCLDLKDAVCSDTTSGTLNYGGPGTAPTPVPSANLVKCQKKIESGSRSLTKTIGTKLGGCAEKIVECKLANEVDSVDAAACLASATSGCMAVPTKYTDAQSKMKSKMLTACGLIEFAVLEEYVQGLGFQNLAAACAVSTGPALLDCLLAANKCSAEHELFIRDPRAQDSLTTAGVASSFPCVTTTVGCADGAVSCTSGADCCSAICRTGGTCAPTSSCLGSGAACTNNGQCCTGTCSGGTTCS